MDVTWQTDSSDCRVLSVSYVFDLCCGCNPCSVVYDLANLREHLVVLHLAVCSTFNCDYALSSKTVESVELHCSCRMPKVDGGHMACCYF